MPVTVKDFALGRKTFFITPDTSLFPEHFLEEYFALGYECYFLDNSRFIPLEVKIDTILSVFEDVILFFNIDYELPGVIWTAYIKELQERFPELLIGVTFTKHSDKFIKEKLEKRYLFDIGIRCGCVQLEYQKKDNMEIIQKILYANQAKGRRKNIRALCTKSCTFSFKKNETYYNGKITDISLSHFSVVMETGSLRITMWEKVKDVQIMLHGFMFRSDALLIAMRPIRDGMLYVFAFITPTGEACLEEIIRARLVPHLYSMMNESCHVLLEKLYNTKINENPPVDDLANITLSD